MSLTAGINNKKKLLLKPFSSVARLRCTSSLASKEKADEKEAKAEEAGRRFWMPHPRTGIYFPRGQEWVMEDIPSGAASFDCTFWMRGIDGVDHHKHDNHDFAPKFPSFKN